MKKVFIIAEAGVNHNGDLELAKQLIEVASQAGVDAVKFQTFQAKHLVSSSAPKADYQLETTEKNESQFEMLKKLELNAQDHHELIAVCQNKGIQFLSTPFDNESISLLEKFNLPIYKIPSGEITNQPYLKQMGALAEKLILSTGMSTLGEVEEALQVLEDAGVLRKNITLLHCTTEYPAPLEEVNLKAMRTLKEAFQLEVGYSDHTPGIEISLAAVALGATVIEKHFTLDKTMDGPDHKASLEPDELKALVQSIRHIEKAMGNGIKQPSSCELKNKEIVRKSIVAACDIAKGDMLTTENITVKRPGTGISPMRWNEVIGNIASKDYQADDLI